MTKYRILKFRNGKYAVSKESFGSVTEYADITGNFMWRKKDLQNYCQGTKEQAIEIYKRLTDNGRDVTGEIFG